MPRPCIFLLALTLCGTELCAWGSTEDPLKVFILAGQSNMVGAGEVRANPDRNGGLGTLEHLVSSEANRERFGHLVDQDGDWVVRDDVCSFVVGYVSNGAQRGEPRIALAGACDAERRRRVKGD